MKISPSRFFALSAAVLVAAMFAASPLAAAPASANRAGSEKADKPSAREEKSSAGKEEKISSLGATIELKGLLVPFEQATLSSQTTGIVRTMRKEGDEMREGEEVVQLDSEMEKLVVAGQQALLDKRRFELESITKLRAARGGSEDEFRTAQTNFRTAETQRDQAQNALDRKTIKAPFNGVITRRVRSPGEAVDQYVGPLLTMVNISKVYLETFLPANRLKDVQRGQEVLVRVADVPARSFKGQVDFVAPVIDPASGEFRIKILIPNEDRALRSGMSAVGQLAVINPGPTELVPPTASSR